PDNQIDDHHPYFDLKVKPAETQRLETIIYNNEDKEITVKVWIHNASTNSNGLIIYEEQEETDPSLTYPINEILTLEKEEVTVPAGESVSVFASLQVPEKDFEGILLGGLHFEKVTEEEEKQSEGVAIQNKYAYVIGVQLTETDTKILPNLQLNDVTPTLVNYRTAVVANVQNSAPTIVRDLVIQAKVFKNGTSAPIKSEEYEHFRMAPNSNMDIIINWENQALEAGDYRLELLASTEGDEWEWNKPFTIDVEAEELNEEAVELEEKTIPTWGWIIIGIGIGLAACVIALLLYIKKLKKNNYPDK
ncbi:DUF916 and DUF3324 domain-containing protein, partial [Carnobacterium sp.]|uniref:DUF916 and DUF3324 domain-containing protein n=1 Tax=Carnobacterium sp. TaxID=48221 RepID=UPI0028A86CB6